MKTQLPSFPSRLRKSHPKIVYLLRRWLRSKGLAIAIFLGIMTLLLTLTPCKVIFNQHFWLQVLQAYDCCKVPLFVTIFAVLTVFGIPGTVLTVVGGLLFGIWWGTLWSVVGATVGALGAFWVARYVLRETVKHKFDRHHLLCRFQEAVARKPIQFVLAVRFAPISPFNIVNFLFGLTPIHWFPYTLATFIGIIPGTLAYTWLGVSGQKALQGQNYLSLVLALAFLSLLSILPLLAGRQSFRSNSKL